MSRCCRPMPRQKRSKVFRRAAGGLRPPRRHPHPAWVTSLQARRAHCLAFMAPFLVVAIKKVGGRVMTTEDSMLLPTVQLWLCAGGFSGLDCGTLGSLHLNTLQFSQQRVLATPFALLDKVAYRITLRALVCVFALGGLPLQRCLRCIILANCSSFRSHRYSDFIVLSMVSCTLIRTLHVHMLK
ncbi:hypothetical protein F5888DRAFT_371296 [Russula emetica]|nr:hypothetical protein F5888DRAFT_371296 [Russula emetica]